MAGKKAFFVVGTRPEIIKTACLYRLMSNEDNFTPVYCFTGQHHELVHGLFDFFDIDPDYDLKALSLKLDLDGLQYFLIDAIERILISQKPDVVIVQGDTISCLSGTIAAFNLHIPVVHVEAGLRSGNYLSPYPEEGIRTLVDSMSAHLFPPTKEASSNLKAEGLSHIYDYTGNTGIDALLYAVKKIELQEGKILRQDLVNLIGEIKSRRQRTFLLTMHRRELTQKKIKLVLEKIDSLREAFDADIVVSMHKNPFHRQEILKHWSEKQNIHLLESLTYPDFVYLMMNADLIFSDSGGLQEETPYLGKKLIILRNDTERPEALSSGTILGGSDLSLKDEELRAFIEDQNPDFKLAFGDGSASNKILEQLKKNII